MKRFACSAVVGIGIAGVLLASPAARADEETKGRSTASDSSRQGGSGMGGVSTGARPGEASGAGPAGEVSAAAGGPQQEISGKVEKYDREKRTLSLANS